MRLLHVGSRSLCVSRTSIGCSCEKYDLGVHAFHDVYNTCYVRPGYGPFSFDVDSRLGKELELAARGFFQVERRSFPRVHADHGRAIRARSNGNNDRWGWDTISVKGTDWQEVDVHACGPFVGFKRHKHGDDARQSGGRNECEW